MNKPENNPIVLASLLKILPKYQNLDRCVMDRVCGFALKAKEDPALKQIKYWAIDHFHALRHKKSSAYNPLHVKRLGRRFKRIKLSAAEQVSSGFRNYARLLNEARPLRHSFKVLYFVKLHNLALRSKRATYLNQYQGLSKKTSKSFACIKACKPILRKPAKAVKKWA